jgi:hypothetical protein
MLDQSFSAKSLLRLIDINDIIKYKLGREKSEYLESLEKISEKISDSNFTMQSLHNFFLGKKPAFAVTSAEEYFALKKISDNMSRIYKINLKTRDEISSQLHRIVQHTNSYSIVRGDIKSFYESIRYEKVLEKLKNDSLISYKSISILENISGIISSGLPRGLSISAVMSEIFIRDFDRYIEQHPNVYFYSRYVDDFIIITTDNADYIKSEIETFLDKKLGLKLNKKTKVLHVPEAALDKKNTQKESSQIITFLGYEYTIRNSIFENIRSVRVTPSAAKINKIKSRIIYSFLDLENKNRNKDQNIELFKKRILLLSGNYAIRESKDAPKRTLSSGIYYTNKITNDSSVFNQLNRFIAATINCRKSNQLGKLIARNIDENLKKEILSIDFRKGFVDRVNYIFSTDQISDIKECWRRRV